MQENVISYRLDLIVHLIDTTTGKTIQEKNVCFYAADVHLQLDDKGEAGYILVNHGRKNFSLKVSVYGYEETKLPVLYETLDNAFPTVEVFLVPMPMGKAENDFISIQGTLSGIEAIEAIVLDTGCYHVWEYDQRKKIITVENTHKLNEGDSHYGLYEREQMQYEHLKAVQHLSKYAMKIDKQVALEPVQNFLLSRVIFGQIKENGDYLLRLRERNVALSILVKFTVNGVDRFQKINCMELPERKLKEWQLQ